MKQKKKEKSQPASPQQPVSSTYTAEIQELIHLLQSSNVAELSIERKDVKITLKTYNAVPTHGLLPPAMAAFPSPPAAAPQAVPVTTTQQPAPAPTEATTADEANYVTVRSPMVGTFYRSASPDKPPFVSVGDVVQKGQVLCMIEAMKLFNEIESEVSGRIVKVLVENAKPVEYDQPLFLIEPM